MENLIGRKVKGFKFEHRWYAPAMDKQIGKIGEIIKIDGDWVLVKIKGNTWFYPLDQIEAHLVHESPSHYDNTNGSIYKFCNDQKLNAWEFDAIKRIVRCRKKGMFREDLEKTKVLIDLYLKEFDNE